MNDDNMVIRDEIDVIRAKYVALKKFANEMWLKPEEVLQQSSVKEDGNFYLP